MVARRVLIIGVDGATFDLIRPWAAVGRLPTFGRLMAEGAHGDLLSVPNMLSPAAWTSFATGKNPGKHGIFHFVELPPGSYEARYVKGADRQGKSLWRLASEAGRRVGVINVPLTYPAERVNGFMIAGLDAPGTDSPGFTYPPQLLAEVESAVGEYIIQPGVGGFVYGGREDLAIQRMHETIERRAAATRYLMGTYPWDLLTVVFTQTDAVQHFFWRDLDPTHPGHDAGRVARYGQTVYDIYRHIDDAIAHLVRDAGPETMVVVMSDHGFGATRGGGFYLNHILEIGGLLRFVGSDDGRGDGALRAGPRRAAIRTARAAYYALHRRLGREAKLRLARRLPKLRERVESAFRIGEIDWTQTRAFSDRSRYEIWVNLRGRQPRGTVSPGEEYEAVREEIAALLRECVEVSSGEPIVERVLRREELYWGANVHKAPDLRVEFRDRPIAGIALRGRALRWKDLRMSPIERIRNGDHRRNGILLVRGPGVEAGRVVQGATLMDVAPTVLYLLGLPVPSDMDGRVLAELFSDTFRAGRPVQTADAESGEDGQQMDFTAEEAERVADRLKSLGYI